MMVRRSALHGLALLAVASGLGVGIWASGRVLPAPPGLAPHRLESWWRVVGPVVAVFAVVRLGIIVVLVGWAAALAAGVVVRVLWRTGGLAPSLARCLVGWSVARGWRRGLVLALGLSASSGLLAACGGAGGVGGVGASGGQGAPSRGGHTYADVPVLVGPVGAVAQPALPVGTAAGGATPAAEGSSAPAAAKGPSAQPAKGRRALAPSTGPRAAPPAVGASIPPSKSGAAAANGTSTAPMPAAAAAAPPLAQGEGTWTVRAGDDFWSIAEAVVTRGRPAGAGGAGEVGRYWAALLAANKDRLPVPGDPDLLFAGDQIALPPRNGSTG